MDEIHLKSINLNNKNQNEVNLHKKSILKIN